MEKNVIADWQCALQCDCPKCGEYVDLLEDGDFWDGRCGLEVCENGTDRSKNLDVVCPDCGHEFKVDCEY